MKRIAILTSGGDAPGMNPCIRSLVRTGIYYDMEMFGVIGGYEGLLDNNFVPMQLSSVGDILQRGGTILRTARSSRFMTEEGLQLAVGNLNENNIDCLVVIGGNGSLMGAQELAEKGVNVLGLPGTIDNDLGYTDFTIGFDTAVNTVLCAISNIRDTASSHERTTIIEVMGRDCGDIALYAGLAGGAESILIPELPISIEKVCKKLEEGIERGKLHNIIIKAEGAPIETDELIKEIKERTGVEAKTVVLSYLQRGGSPTASDRMLASLLGQRAIELADRDDYNKAIGISRNEIIDLPLKEAIKIEREVDIEKISLIDILSK